MACERRLALLLLLVLCVNARWCEAIEDDGSPSLPQQFMYLQNVARAQVRVPPLQWSPVLAAYAQWWANQNALHYDCTRHHSGGPYGENIFWGSGKPWEPFDAVSNWVNEKSWYNYFYNSCEYDDACGHYTQIVWASSRFVGCARVTCDDGRTFITCNYAPPGNYIGQRPY